jgi:hypothetical protein
MQNVMQAMIVDSNNLSLPTISDDAQALTIYRCIAAWLVDMAGREKRRRFLCLDCDAEFHDRRRPAAFAVSVPLMRGGGQAWATGICRHCAVKEDDKLLQKMVEHMRSYYPDLTFIQGGHA